ncbi:MAG: metallophosphoesterase [Actinobacteria bacterium]|nr:metallophosphoesterase [Actinomycetota bacterium]
MPMYRLMSTRISRALVFLTPVLLVTAMLVLFMTGNEARAAPGIQDTPRITKLIYPTLGNPAIKKRGESLTIEYDPREGSSGSSIPEITAFQVTVSSSNDKYPHNQKLPVTSFEVKPSEVWYWLKNANFDVYHVTVTVPYSLPPDLYDLTIKAKTGGSWVTDKQPNAFQAVDEFKDHFSFVQLTDIHVFGPECDGAEPFYAHKMTDRDYRPPGGQGAIYYQKAIQQINRMKPDFVVITGDMIFGQEWLTRDYGDFPEYAGTKWDRVMTEYEFEMDWFYEETLKLDVPVFMTIGNHDGYKDDHEDWFVNWGKLFAPQFFAYDYGDYHFLSPNSMDWTSSQRTLTDYLGIILKPTKFMGQLRGGGDKWKSGATQAQFDAVNEDNFKQQLAWMRDELKASQDAKMRIVAMHHDPWVDDGSGAHWDSTGGRGGFDGIFGGWMDMGDGEGRIASMKLMRDYKVSLALSGHDHADSVGSLGWTGGAGEVKFVNTRAVSFESDGDSEEYPAYRRIWIKDGQVESYNYLDPRHSYPLYRGTNVGGSTDMGGLSIPAVESSFAPEPGSAQDVTCTITNHLEKPLPGAYVEFPMPALSNKYYYKVADGSFGHVYDTGNHRVCQVHTDVAASSAKAPRVYKSASPDTKAPAGSFKINNGAATTTTREVTLNINASDTGGSGLKDMMISNTPEFQGATWEKYDSTRKWTLAGGTAGRRHVYMKFRDMAMPANESSVAEDEIMYSPAEDEGGPAYTWYFAEGCTRAGFEEWLCIQNPNDSECDVDITYMTETGENIPQTVTVGPESRHTVDVNSAVGPERDVSMKVEGSLPIMAERPMYFNYQGMWKGGHDVIGTNNPRTRWYFAEGCTRESPSGNFHTWLCMQNPQDEEVQVTITYMLETGENHVREVSIPPLSRKTEGVNSDVGPGQDVSIMVESAGAIICERPMYFNYQGIQDGGHAVMGAVQPANEWYLAEGTTHGGFSTYVCMQNPNDTDAGVTLQYMLQDGNADDQELVIPARSRKTVLVNDWVGPANNVSIKVSSDNPIITERPMYFNYGSGWPGGHCVVGAPSPKGEWYFAEGCTRAGFEEWLSIQNPSDTDANVRISYMWEDGTNLNQGVDVPAGSRATVNVNDFMAGSEHDISATVISEVPIIVERPMYFNYHDSWPGGHCVVGSCIDAE